MDKAAIVIIHYQSENDTRECLNSIYINNVRSKQFDVIVVINPPQKNFPNKNNFVTSLKREYPQIYIIENNYNTGFAKGNNIGINKALVLGSEYILILNNDTIVSLDLLDKLINHAKSDSHVGIISPKIYFAKGYEYHKNRYKEDQKGRVIWYAGGIIDWSNIYVTHKGVDEVDKDQYDDVSETDFATGCCMLIKRNTIERIGLFDEKYFMYYEDIDYSMRVKQSKMKVVYFPEAIIWHKNASSSGKPGSKLHIYYQNRNRLYFGFKYASLRTKKSLFLDSLKSLVKGEIYTKSIFDYYFGRMGELNI